MLPQLVHIYRTGSSSSASEKNINIRNHRSLIGEGNLSETEVSASVVHSNSNLIRNHQVQYGKAQEVDTGTKYIEKCSKRFR